MKTEIRILTVIGLAVFALAGCSKSGGDDAASVDSSALQSSFAGAEASLKSAADTAIAAINSADYSKATAELTKLAENAKLTDAQKDAITDVLAQLQEAVASAGTNAAEDAGKALEGAGKALGQ